MPNTPPESTQPWLVAALYKFVRLEDLESLQTALQEVCKANDIMGTLLLASEGINGTISGSDEGIGNTIKWLTSNDIFSDLDVKYSRASEAPFLRMKVPLSLEFYWFVLSLT